MTEQFDPIKNMLANIEYILEAHPELELMNYDDPRRFKCSGCDRGHYYCTCESA